MQHINSWETSDEHHSTWVRQAHQTTWSDEVGNIIQWPDEIHPRAVCTT